MNSPKTVQYLVIDLYKGNVIENKQVPVVLSKPIVPQVMEEVIPADEDDRNEIIAYMIPQFKSTATGYKINGEEQLYLILL